MAHWRRSTPHIPLHIHEPLKNTSGFTFFGLKIGQVLVPSTPVNDITRVDLQSAWLFPDTVPQLPEALGQACIGAAAKKVFFR